MGAYMCRLYIYCHSKNLNFLELPMTYNRKSFDEMMQFFRDEILKPNTKAILGNIVIMTDSLGRESYSLPEDKWDKEYICEDVYAYAASDGKQDMIVK
jgi:hypothetical protein